MRTILHRSTLSQALLAGLVVLGVNGQLLADARPASATTDSPAIQKTEMVQLPYRNEPVNEAMLTFISKATGKVVVPANLQALKDRKVSAITAVPVPGDRAIDILFQSMRVNGIGVIERETDIVVGELSDIAQMRLLPVVPADESILDRTDGGTLILKIFRLRNASATDVFAHITGSLMQTSTYLSVDASSNQLLLAADVALCQHVERMLDELDRHTPATMKVYTLRYAEAVDVVDTLSGLFTEPETVRPGPRARVQRAAPAPAPFEAPTNHLIGLRRLEPYAAANMVFVVGSPEAIERVGLAIAQMDQPTEYGLPFVIKLEHADAEAIAAELNMLLVPAGADQGAQPASTIARAAPAEPGMESLLAGRVRIVPIKRVNGLAILCPASQEKGMRALVAALDRPE